MKEQVRCLSATTALSRNHFHSSIPNAKGWSTTDYSLPLGDNRAKTILDIGETFQQWRDNKELEGGMKRFLLDRYLTYFLTIGSQNHLLSDLLMFVTNFRSVVRLDNAAVSTTAHLCTSSTDFQCLVRSHWQNQQNSGHWKYPDGALQTVKKCSVKRCTLLALNGRHLGYIAEEEEPFRQLFTRRGQKARSFWQV